MLVYNNTITYIVVAYATHGHFYQTRSLYATMMINAPALHESFGTIHIADEAENELLVHNWSAKTERIKNHYDGLLVGNSEHLHNFARID